MSDDVNLRQFVVDALQPLTPKAWKWFGYSTSLDETTDTYVVLTLKSIARLPAAPAGARIVTYTLSIFDPSTNVAQREDSSDDAIVDLLNAIDEIQNLAWTTADRVLDKNSKHIGFDIELTFPITKTKPTEATS